MDRTQRMNDVQARKAQAWEDAFKVFVEGAEVHGQVSYARAVRIMNAVDGELTATLVNQQGEEVECMHCGFTCDCAYYEAGGEYPD